MTHLIGRALIAAALLTAAYLCRAETTRLETVATAWQTLATLGRDVPAPAPPSRLTRWLPASLRPADGVGARQQATADYWVATWDDLVRTRGGDADPAVMHTAANAAYRLARLRRDVGTAAAERLDPVLEAYANVLKADPSHLDAAWNYEFVSRTRDVLASARLSGPRRTPPNTPGLAPPLPGATVHGVAGAPPPEIKSEQFETIAPMDFGDREAQPEPTPGTYLKRKG
jgi:hypothetical protein